MASTVWRGRLAFGMVSVPVRMYKAARRERIRFHHVYRPADEPAASPAEEPDEPESPPPFVPSNRVREFPIREVPRSASPPIAADPEPEPVARVRSAPLAEGSRTPLPQQSILKGYEAEKDRYVVFEPHEISALRPRTSSDLQIVEFAQLNEIDPIFFDASYYLAPDKGGEKPYAILFAALQKSGYVALGSLAMHGREHATVIRAGSRGLILHTLFYENEVRREEEWATNTNLAGEKELELAGMLVHAMEARFDAGKLKDTFEERLRGLIESRAPVPLAGAAPSPGAGKPPIVDIVEALRRSLEAARKPVQAERREPKTSKASGQKRKRS